MIPPVPMKTIPDAAETKDVELTRKDKDAVIREKTAIATKECV